MVSSGSAEKDIARFFGRSGAKIHVVPFAVQSAMKVEAPRIADVVAKYDLPENYLFLPNQFWRHKNHETAFRALRELRGRGNSPVVALSGQMKDFRYQGHAEKLRALAQELDIEGNLKWLGSIPYDDLLHLTAGSRALLNPSLFEGWSTTVEEAKCLGAPMVLSALDVHREQAEGRAEFFAPLSPVAMADAIEGSIAKNGQTDIETRLRRAQDAYCADIDRYAERLTTAIDQTMADHRSSRRA
jgi:glycosyltransferase involved in cell wall biosynthesis